ncbi:MAG TPA: YXWGXW repeat-containing protein [Mucilaginibacter sp.]|jgi:hypothetical protein|nr:YXWGXW repeat-containing protein [Mucilaginibacter sp.]
MKKLALIVFSLLVYGVTKAQTVVDTYPSAQIFAINYQTGQQVQVNSDEAIAFKDAFIDLVSNTGRGRRVMQAAPPQTYTVIKQINPRNMNGYQLTYQVVNFNRVRAIASFYYNIDENALYYFEPRAANWAPVRVEGPNLTNLNNCAQYARFNSSAPGQVPDLSANGNAQTAVPDLSANNNTNQSTLASDVSNALDDDQADQEITSKTAPPAMPDYDQPPCPVDGYLWQPGYWAWSITAADYYWIPGVWVAPPHPGVLWTPGYWGFVGGVYRFHPGYWGATVGFYGGIHYGFGYFGVGFVGGEWHGGAFRYNTAVVHVNTTVVRNVYVNKTVINNTTVVNRTSFNRQGGVAARPTATETAAMSQQHFRPTAEQVAHQQAAVTNKGQFAAVNKGAPATTSQDHITATPHNNPGNGQHNFGQRAGNNKNKGNKPPRQRGGNKKQKN